MEENDYGTCGECHKPFEYNDRLVRMVAINKGVSQGYPIDWEGDQIDLCLTCFKNHWEGSLPLICE